MAIFSSINTSSRARMRMAKGRTIDDSIDLINEQKRREANLSPEKLEAYKKELAELSDELRAWYKKNNVIDGGMMEFYYHNEKDYIMGKYLGQDLREDPEYISHIEKEKRLRSLSIEKIEAYKKELEEMKNKLFSVYPKGEAYTSARLSSEEDYIMGKYLGQDLRKYPEYVSEFVDKKIENIDTNHKTL